MGKYAKLLIFMVLNYNNTPRIRQIEIERTLKAFLLKFFNLNEFYGRTFFVYAVLCIKCF